MKTLKFLMVPATIAALFMSSCSQEEELLINGNNPTYGENAVMFDTYVSSSPASRSTCLDTETLKEHGFGVYAYFTGKEDFAVNGRNTTPPNFMFNQKIWWDTKAGAWTYSPVKYWPNNFNDKVSFFAYAPYAENTDTINITNRPGQTTTGDPIISFKTAAEVGKQTDLLYAGNNLLDINKETVSDKVHFQFMHALARIGFKALVLEDTGATKNDGEPEDPSQHPDNGIKEGSKVVIDRVSFSSAYLPISGDFNLRTGEWSNKTIGVQKYTLSGNDLVNNVLDHNSNPKNPLQLNAPDKYLMLIPTTLTDNDPKRDAIEITVYFNVITEDPKLPNREMKISSEVTTYLMRNFNQGKAYNFVLHIGLTSVKCDAYVEDWNGEGEKNKIEELTVNSPMNDATVLIFDANGGKFKNGSSQCIISRSTKSGGDDLQEFKILEVFKQTTVNGALSGGYVSYLDELAGWLPLCGWSENPYFEITDNVHPETGLLQPNEEVYVESGKSKTIYAIWYRDEQSGD